MIFVGQMGHSHRIHSLFASFIFPPHTCPKTAATINRGMTSGVSKSNLRRTYMSGMGRWMYRNHGKENFLTFDRRNPNGRLTASVKNVSPAKGR
jgi:hypothetical protein